VIRGWSVDATGCDLCVGGDHLLGFVFVLKGDHLPRQALDTHIRSDEKQRPNKKEACFCRSGVASVESMRRTGR
jgi:hypothetical protein